MMFTVKIIADIHDMKTGALMLSDSLLSGQEWESWGGSCALEAFERLADHIDKSRVHQDVRNIRVIVRRAEDAVWGEDELAPYHEATLDDITEALANTGALDENWPGVDATDDERAELGAALNATFAEWARKHSITSNAWRDVEPPILELPAYLERGHITVSNGARLRLAELSQLRDGVTP